jgi:FkbM family methyltransferase
MLTLSVRVDSSVMCERVGAGYGGWWVPAAILDSPGSAVLVGAGEDISADIELHRRGFVVICMDPTPRAIEHVRLQAPLGDRFRFWPVALWDSRTTVRLYEPRDAHHVSHSALNLQRTRQWIDVPSVRLIDVLSAEGLSAVDLLKLDIEGAEHRVIRELLTSAPKPRSICVEFDQPMSLRRILRTVRLMQETGYRAVHRERWNWTFQLAETSRR